MRFGSLFTGIGGLDLGLERAGMECAFQVEIDPFCQRVLATHWPEVPRYTDINLVDPRILPDVDVLCGGFPCQDISQAASQHDRPGVDGERSRLWREYVRFIRTIRPHYVIVENTASLRYAGRGLDRVLGDLARLGYDAEWEVLRASEIGAPHHRARIWLVAYPHSHGQPDCTVYDETHLVPKSGAGVRQWPDPPEDVRVDDGVSTRMALRAYGNAVVPAAAEEVGRAVVSHAARMAQAVA